MHDTIDFWRVSSVAANEHLQLAAEMKLPGDAWLEWRIDESAGDRKLVQTAYFASKGLAGVLYWYSLYPIHGFIFSGMIDVIAQRAVDYSQTAVIIR